MHLTQDGTSEMPTTNILMVKDLSVYSNEKCLVNSLSFELGSGQCIALVGESGSGKSLTALSVMGLLSQSLKVQGSIVFQQQQLTEADEARLCQIRGKKIAMVFQEPMSALNPLHRVEKLIGETFALQGLTKAQQREQVIELLNMFDIQAPETKLSRFVHELSGGERQRVMIAAAIAQRPEILIADEPTTSLDMQTQKKILQCLEQIKLKRKMAIILISHDLHLVKRYADQVIVLNQGEVIEQGYVGNVFNRPREPYTQSLLKQNFGRPLPISSDAPIILEAQQLSVEVKASNPFWRLKRTGQDNILTDIHFKLPEGRTLGIVGESGSGKTTLALALLRLIASQGHLYFQGTDLNLLPEKNLKAYRARLQIVFQDPFASLNPRMSVYQLMAEGLKAQHLSKSEMSHLIDTGLAQVELDLAFKSYYPHQLSGGQRQRVALARVLVLNPTVIVFDEVTSSLDRVTQRNIIDLLRRIQHQRKISYIFISHDLQAVRALCHEVLVLKSGKLLNQQSTEDLFNLPQTDYIRELIEASYY